MVAQLEGAEEPWAPSVVNMTLVSKAEAGKRPGDGECGAVGPAMDSWHAGYCVHRPLVLRTWPHSPTFLFLLDTLCGLAIYTMALRHWVTHLSGLCILSFSLLCANAELSTSDFLCM